MLTNQKAATKKKTKKIVDMNTEEIRGGRSTTKKLAPVILTCTLHEQVMLFDFANK